LLPIPKNYVREHFGLDNSRRKLFNIIGEWLVVFDESGRAFIGMATRHVLESLVAANFELDKSLKLPLVGRGQTFGREPLRCNCATYYVYPVWMPSLGLADRSWGKLNGMVRVFWNDGLKMAFPERVAAIFPAALFAELPPGILEAPPSFELL
jgi:hypothetical protein